MCKNDILLQKSGAKVLLFIHMTKLIAQKQTICAHFGRFVQLILMELIVITLLGLFFHSFEDGNFFPSYIHHEEVRLA